MSLTLLITRRRFSRALCTVAAWSIPGAFLYAQQPEVRVANRAACSNCTIALRKIVDVGSSSDSISLKTTTNFGVDSRGFIFAVGSYADPSIVQYDSSGKLLRTIGRRGQGPGEFAAPRRVVPAGDRIYVLDTDAARVTSLNAQTLAVNGVVAVPRRGTGASDLLIVDGTFVSMAFPSSRTGTGSVMLFSEKGLISDTIAKLHNQSAPEDASGELRHARFLARSVGSTFWTLRLNKYQLDRWDLSGRKLQTIVRDAPWFAPWPASALSGSPFQVAQPPMSSGVREDADGLVWVMVVVPRADYKPVQAGSSPPISDLHKYYETRVELIDPKVGTLVATTTIPGWGRFVDGTFAIATYVSDSDGNVRWSIFRPSLIRP